jgi:hypothetical protein
MPSTVILKINRLRVIAFALQYARLSDAILERLESYYGSTDGCLVTQIASEYDEQGIAVDVYKIVSPDSNWLVTMKLDPSTAEQFLLKYATITYTDNK